MVGWHDQLNGYEFEQTPGDSEGQGSVVYSSLWGQTGSDPMDYSLARHLCPCQNTGVGCKFLFQGIFPTQGLILRLLWLLSWQVDSSPLSHQGSPIIINSTHIVGSL